jgi:EAL domain-containing protein (putative c-di-GMP-specific phosphodiesterase class I)
VKLDLVIAALITSAALRQRVQALAAEHVSIWRPVDDLAALRTLLERPGVEPDLIISDGDGPELVALLGGRPLIVIGTPAQVPANVVVIAPEAITSDELAEAMVNAINLARIGRLLHGNDADGAQRGTRSRTSPVTGFDVHFQPQWSIGGQHLTAAEALLRWHGLEVAALRPESYIAAAEAQGQIALLGDWIIERACELAGAWLPDWPDGMVLALNVTPAQIAAPAFAETVLQAVASQGLDRLQVDFDLCAQHLPVLAAEHESRLRYLHELGFGFALDRVGASVFDPALMQRLPLRALKIDRMLIGRIERDAAARRLVVQLAELALRLGLSCIAVGVETAEQRELVETAGCDALQGRLLADAMPAAEFGALLRAQRERRRGP